MKITDYKRLHEEITYLLNKEDLEKFNEEYNHQKMAIIFNRIDFYQRWSNYVGMPYDKPCSKSDN